MIGKTLEPLKKFRIYWPCEYISSTLLEINADHKWISDDNMGQISLLANFYGWHIFYRPNRIFSLYLLGSYTSKDDALYNFNRAIEIVAGGGHER